MDRVVGTSLVTTHPPAKPEGGLGMARPRKRLQKPTARQPRLELPTRLSGTLNEQTTEPRVTGASKLAKQAQPPHAPPQILIPPPDLSDSKWADYLSMAENEVVSSPVDSTQHSQESHTVSGTSFPEFAHLTPADEKPRPSIDSSRTHTSASSVSARVRRQAKTPVLRIGQLESKSRVSGTKAPHSREPRRSAEVIAEEYRALLDARDPAPSDQNSERISSQPPQEPPLRSPARLRSSPTGTPETSTPPPQADLSGCSPASDDGTLVSFEEETIYFKPLSFSPEPQSPLPAHYDFSPPPSSSSSRLSLAPSTVPKSLSLQICLDLLARELSSALCDRPFRAAAEVSSLQVWVMIEAYERLRDQLCDSGRLPPEDVPPLEAMLDTWLRALYRVHESLSAAARSKASQTDLLGNLQSEELD